MRHLPAPLVLRVAAVALVIALSSCAGPDSSPEGDEGTYRSEVAERGGADLTVLHVPVSGFADRDESGRLSGVTVEIMRAFGHWLRESQGLEVTLHFVEEPDWETFYRRVRDARGGVFGLGNVTITEERREELAFSPSYLTNVALLITHESVPELTDFEALPRTFEGLSALAFEGTLHETRLLRIRSEYAPSVELARTNSNRDIIERVAGGGYFAYIDAYNYWVAREEGLPVRHHPIGNDPSEEFGIIMPLDNDWALLLAEFFEQNGGLRNTRAYHDLLVEHLGQGVAEALEGARGGGR